MKYIDGKMTSEKLYGLTMEICENECPSIYDGLMSRHYFLLISIVITSMTFDYWINSVWKNYGLNNIYTYMCELGIL